jgi:hypothetical protein
MPFSRLAAQRVANLPQNRPSPGHLSALYLLPYVVTAVAGVFDAMHNILLGVNKTLWRSCVVQGEYKTNKGPVESGNRSASALHVVRKACLGPVPPALLPYDWMIESVINH